MALSKCHSDPATLRMRNCPSGVLEYLVWIADENRLIWWRLLDDEFVEIPTDADGLMTSVTFPGLVIDAEALTAGDLATALTRLT